MPEHQASRTLVKSAPELWTECSDPASLARHLGSFGEIRITKLEPETAVAWEGEDVSGTVTFEPSGWGTRVTLTAQAVDQAPPAAPTTPAQSGEPASAGPARPTRDPPALGPPSGAPDRRAGLLASLLAWVWRRPAAVTPATEVSSSPDEFEASPQVMVEPPPASTSTALVSALNSLGAAHRRPFSRG